MAMEAIVRFYNEINNTQNVAFCHLLKRNSHMIIQSRRSFYLVGQGITAVAMLLVGGALATAVCYLQKGQGPQLPDIKTTAPQPLKSDNIDVGRLAGLRNIIPVAVIGSGPAGLSAAVYSARELPTVVFLGEMPGGLLTQTTEVENWPGEKTIMGPKLMANLQEQAEHLGAQVVVDTIEKIDLSRWPFALKTSSGLEVNALSVIVATGAAPKYLGIPGEKEYWGKGVTACAVCDAPFFKGEDVVVIGGGDSAVEEALQLSRHVKSVTVLVRKGRMRAKESMQDRLRGYSNISVRYNVEPRRIVGDDVKVTGIELYDAAEQKTEVMPTAGVFLAIGHQPNTKLLIGELDLDENGYIELQGRSQKASIPGVFAAGDVEDHVYRQAGVAAGSGIKAALDALAFLRHIGFDEKVSASISGRLYSPKSTTSDITTDQFQQDKEPIAMIDSVQELDYLVKTTQKPLVIDFYADHCTICLRMMPMLQQVARQMANQVTFVKVNIDEVPGVAQKYMVTSLPTIQIYKDASLAVRNSKVASQAELVDLISQVMS